MKVLLGLVILLLGLICFWSIAGRWRNVAIVGTSLVLGALMWPEATLLALGLVIVYPLRQAVPHWFMVLIYLSPLVFQKIGNIGFTGLSYVSFLALALYIDNHSSNVSIDWRRRLWVGALFPLVPAGPIERWQNLESQYENKKPFRAELFLSGIVLITFGIFKKFVIADRLLYFVADHENKILSYSGSGLWAYLSVSLILVYCDFSAVIDIVRGIGRLFGLELMDNFDRPYLATSVQDIWRRWHISLVNFLRDTIYNWVAIRTRSVTLASAAVLLLVGLWHGVKWQSLTWSLYWILLFWLGIYFRTKGWKFGAPNFVKRTLCVLAMALSGVFMVPESLTELILLLERSLLLASPSPELVRPLGISTVDLTVALGGFAIVLVFEQLMGRLKLNYLNVPIGLNKGVVVSSALVALLFIYLTVAFGMSRWQGFIYMRY